MEATTTTRYDENNFPLFDYDAHDFDEVRRGLAERYVENDTYDTGEEPEDWDSAIEHELEVMDDWSVWEEINRLSELDLTEAIDQIEERTHDSGMVIAIGTIGLWDGTYDGGCVSPSAGAAVNKIWGECGSQSNVQTIEVRNGDVHVSIAHHDGRCDFAMRGLTDAGCDALDEWEGDEGPLAGLSEAEAHKALFGSDEWSYSMKPVW